MGRAKHGLSLAPEEKVARMVVHHTRAGKDGHECECECECGRELPHSTLNAQLKDCFSLCDVEPKPAAPFTQFGTYNQTQQLPRSCKVASSRPHLGRTSPP